MTAADAPNPREIVTAAAQDRQGDDTGHLVWMVRGDVLNGGGSRFRRQLHHHQDFVSGFEPPLPLEYGRDRGNEVDRGREPAFYEVTRNGKRSFPRGIGGVNHHDTIGWRTDALSAIPHRGLVVYRHLSELPWLACCDLS